MIKVTLKRSLIGARKDQVATIRALGLKRIGDVREVVDNVSTRGMLRKVEHLVQIEGQEKQ